MKKLPRRLAKPKPIIVVVVLLLICLGFFAYFILRDLPSPTKLATNNSSQSTQIYDRNGILLYTIYGNRNQTFVPLNQIPKNVQNATIAIEDKDFYHHGAIDMRGIARSFFADVTHHPLQGGSTLTQQLVKNTLLTQQQTITRKVREIILAFLTEIIYPKDKILEMYLNQSPYGGTSYGVDAAAETFFGKSITNVDLAQAAYLAGLPESPTEYSPFGSHPELGIQRQHEVLQQMLDQKYITQQQYNKAIHEQLHFQTIASNTIKAPHFVLYIKDLLVQKYGEQEVEQGGLKVITSLDLNLQNYAQASVSAEVENIKGDHVSNGAALITSPKTGEILAMVGSTDYFDTANDGQVNVTLAHRQPGSSIKPINYALGITNGYGAGTPFIDQPTCFGANGSGGNYCPLNYDLKWHGIVTMRQALGNSFNIPAVKMLKVNGVANMIAFATKMGISTFTDPSRYGLSLTLGGGEVTMTDMAVAFGVFANQGYRVDLHPILKVTDKNNNVIEQYVPTDSSLFGTKVLDPGVAFIISDILADNNARLAEFGPRSALYIPGKRVSAKTGTTNDFRDNWTLGYTSDWLVATWVGNDDNTPMNGLASGITGAAPIWNDLMSHVLENSPSEHPVQPDNVIKVGACMNPVPSPAPGQSTSTTSCTDNYDYALKGGKPKQYVSQESVMIDKTSNDLAKPGQTDNVEPRSETILTDPSGDKYCLSCPHPSPSPTPTP